MTKRVISAIVLVLVFVPFIIVGELPFTIFMTVLSVLGLYELLKVRETKKKFPLVLRHARLHHPWTNMRRRRLYRRRKYFVLQGRKYPSSYRR